MMANLRAYFLADFHDPTDMVGSCSALIGSYHSGNTLIYENSDPIPLQLAKKEHVPLIPLQKTLAFFYGRKLC